MKGAKWAMVSVALVGTLFSTWVAAKEVDLILVRHGESEFNLQKRFAGWADTPLTEKGKAQATKAGQTLAKYGYRADAIHTSMLSRAIDTAWLVNDASGQSLPQYRYWRLNERHYGDLEGKTHQEVTDQVGEAQVKIWRRSFDIPPPPLSTDDARSPTKDSRYANLPRTSLPVGESLKDTIARLEPYWRYTLAPTLASGKSVMVVAHSNSLKALSSHIDPSLSPDEVIALEIPNATPVIYRLDIGNDGSIKILSRKVLKEEEKPTTH